jgi:hypothetical protein
MGVMCDDAHRERLCQLLLPLVTEKRLRVTKGLPRDHNALCECFATCVQTHMSRGACVCEDQLNRAKAAGCCGRRGRLMRSEDADPHVYVLCKHTLRMPYIYIYIYIYIHTHTHTYTQTHTHMHACMKT